MRVLIISPHFPPSNAADMHRVRMLLPHFAAEGLEVEVLAVHASQVASPTDTWLEEGLPSGVPVHRVNALGLEWSRIPGLGTLSFRALAAIRRKGSELLGLKSFDLIYFSTTQFGIHLLGPEWKKRFGIPFAMDYQDPWVNDYYRLHPQVRPPGGKLKYSVSSWISRRQEPAVLRRCSGITSVSAAYPAQLESRYPWLSTGEPSEQPTRDKQSLPAIVLPFPGDATDLDRVRASEIRQQVFDPQDGNRHWVYVGRGGEDMALAVRGIFSALSTLLRTQHALTSRLRVHFIGTSYAGRGKGRRSIEPLAFEYGLEGIVSEHTDRIPYSHALRCLLDADGLIVPGSNDPGYTASKIYPYLLAGKPLLTVFHEQSSVVQLLAKVGGGTLVSFSSGDTPESIGERILSQAFDEAGDLRHRPLKAQAFEPHTARHQARELAAFFHRCAIHGKNHHSAA
jgi:hypothetical protein